MSVKVEAAYMKVLNHQDPLSNASRAPHTVHRRQMRKRNKSSIDPQVLILLIYSISFQFPLVELLRQCLAYILLLVHYNVSILLVQSYVWFLRFGFDLNESCMSPPPHALQKFYIIWILFTTSTRQRGRVWLVCPLNLV